MIHDMDHLYEIVGQELKKGKHAPLRLRHSLFRGNDDQLSENRNFAKCSSNAREIR